ncbi:MAG: SpoIIE family protein phosphatase [Alphaproteobacteria bacterium]|nr:SpoIIE family protein phosphatase [Alphaproteobacteria bacterium]
MHDANDSSRRLAQSLQHARLIQRAILPKRDVLDATLSDHFQLWEPRDIVGGDFYLCQPAGRGFLVGVVDCTGHGVPGALGTMLAHAVLDQAMGVIGKDPASVLEHTDRTVRELLQADGGEAPEMGLDMGLCWCDRRAGRLVYAGAHNSLLWADGETVVRVKGDRRSLGYTSLGPPARFTNHVVDMPPGRAFYLTTDGFVDQPDERGRSFGWTRFQEMVARHAALPLSAQAEAFAETLIEYQGSSPRRDDVTVLGFRA